MVSKHANEKVTQNLFQLSTDTLHISIDVFDENGIGGGASGVSGGLLHPYTPKGSPLMEFYSC